MANVITLWRQAVVADLQAHYPDAIVESGRRTGTSRDKDRITVRWPGEQEMSARVAIAEARLLIRYRVQNSKLSIADSPLDPGPLEEAGMGLADFLQTKQGEYVSTGVFNCRVVSVTPDDTPEEWSVEAVLLGQFVNPAVV